MDEAKQMTVEEALDAADQIVGFYDGDPYDLIERGCDTLEVLAAEVRRLTAEVEMLRGVGCSEMDGSEMRGPCGACLKCARRERDEARAALATARREGAEAMRERCARRLEARAARLVAAAVDIEAEDGSEDHGRWLESIDSAALIRALPLDAPGGAT